MEHFVGLNIKFSKLIGQIKESIPIVPKSIVVIFINTLFVEFWNGILNENLLKF